MRRLAQNVALRPTHLFAHETQGFALGRPAAWAKSLVRALATKGSRPVAFCA